jgi:hypothetical protein
MSSDNRPEIVLDGDVGPFRRKLREASADLKRFGKDGEQAVGGMAGPLATLQSKFVAIGAILAGGAVFKEAVAQAHQWNEASVDMAAAMGISATAAGDLKAALAEEGVEASAFMATAQKLATNLRNDEAALHAVGLATRDLAGNLRPLNELTVDAIELVGKYKAGTDRAIAASTLFGKGFEIAGDMAKINSALITENIARQRELSAVVTNESVAAFEQYDQAGKRVDAVMRALRQVIGTALMPVLAQLGNWFAAIGPAAVTVIRGALGGLLSLFWGLRTAAVITFETIKAAVFTVAEPIRAVGAAFIKLMQGDFKGAASEIMNIPAQLGAAWSGGWDNVVSEATKARDEIFNLFAQGTETTAPGRTGKSGSGLVRSAEKKEAADPSFMSHYEAELSQRKAVFEQENTLRQFSKEQELAYWRDIQQNLELTSKDRLTIAKRTATLELEIRRQSAKEQRDLDSLMVDSRRAAGLAQIQYEEQQANFARENGDLTKRQLLELEEQYARRRFEIEYQSLLERMELAKNDPNASSAELARIKEQMLEIERNYQMRRGELMQNQKQAGGMGGFFDDIGGSFSQMANTMLTSATTLRQSLGGIFQGIYQSFVSNMITKPLGEWLASQARMLAVKMGFVAQEKAIEAGASASTVAIKGAETTAVVGMNAAEAGTGAAASQASIPIVGPMLALAAMATVFAAVMAMGGKRKSAAGGYDIPKGLNPMTQLHEEEMVLPQKYANVLRGLAGGGEGAVSPAPTSVQHITISAVDARSFRDYLKSNSHALAPGLRQMARNFTPVKGR